MRRMKQNHHYKGCFFIDNLSSIYPTLQHIKSLVRLVLLLPALFSGFGFITVANASDYSSVDQALPPLIKNGEPVRGSQSWYMAHVPLGHFSSSFNQRGSLLALTSVGNPIELWDISKRRLMTTLTGGGFGKSAFVDMSADGKMIALGMNGRIELRNLGNKSLLFSVPVIEGGASTLSKDGRYFATAIDGKRIDLWDTKKEARIHSFTGEYGHKEPVTALQFSYDGRYLISADRGGTVKAWDIILKEFRFEADQHHAPISSLAFSNDSKYFITVDTSGVSRLWSVENGNLMSTLSTARGKAGDFTSAVSFSRNDKKIVVALSNARGNVHTELFHTDSGKSIYAFDSLHSPVNNLSFQKDNRSIAFSFSDKSIKIFDVPSRRFVDTFGGQLLKAKVAAVSSDGGLIAVATVDGVLQLWNESNKRMRYSLKGQNHSLESVAFSTDARFIITGDNKGNVRVWNRNNNQNILKIQAHKNGKAIAAMSPNNQFIITSSSESSVLKLWNIRSKTVLNKFFGHTGSIMALAYSQDGKNIISASLDGTIRVWDASTYKTVTTLKTEKNKRFTSLHISRDNRYLAAGLDAGSTDVHGVEIWDMQTLEHSYSLSDHFKKVTTVRFSPDSTKLVSGSADGTIKVWDFKRGELIASLQKKALPGHPLSPVRSVDFSKNSKSIVSVADDGVVNSWNIASKRLEHTMLGGPRGTWISENHVKKRFWRGDDGTLVVVKGRNTAPTSIIPPALSAKDTLVLTTSRHVVEVPKEGGKFRITVKNKGRNPSFWIRVIQKNKDMIPVTLMPNKLTRLAAGQTGVLDLRLIPHGIDALTSSEKNVKLQLELVTKSGSRFPLSIPLKLVGNTRLDKGSGGRNDRR